MPETVQGILKINQGKDHILLDPKKSFRSQGKYDPIVPSTFIQQYKLVTGAMITGVLQENSAKPILDSIISICDLSPDEFQKRPAFSTLTAIDPHDRFNFGFSKEKSMRILDLMTPIGKGARGMIVSPPKAGKTMLLKQIANEIRNINSKIDIIVLLIDERPEEVTHFRRTTDALVISSSSDQSFEEHIELAELTLAYIQTELECGKEVVLLVDSLTRMGRAFNHKTKNTGRILSGGMEAGAMQIPRRFFGLARNIENGGSVTIIASALIKTGSKMDELIFQEFKGTGNCEIVLDQRLAENRIFPALNITESGTRKEEYLFTPEELENITKLRRALLTTKEPTTLLIELVDKYPTNEQLLNYIAKQNS